MRGEIGAIVTSCRLRQMSSASSDYSTYSGLGTVTKTTSTIAGTAAAVASGGPVTTSTGAIVPRQRRGAGGFCDLFLNALQFAMFVTLIGVSAASIKQIKDVRDAGGVGINPILSPCFEPANLVWRLEIGILVVACAGAASTIAGIVLSSVKVAPFTRYALTFCTIPGAVVLVVLGCIILGWGSPAAGPFIPAEVCRDTDPYRLAFALGAIATAVGGWILVFGPGFTLIAIVSDLRNNPYVMTAQQVVQMETANVVTRARLAKELEDENTARAAMQAAIDYLEEPYYYDYTSYSV